MKSSSPPSRGKSAPAPLLSDAHLQLLLGCLLRPAEFAPAVDWPKCEEVDGYRWAITRDLDGEGGDHA